MYVLHIPINDGRNWERNTFEGHGHRTMFENNTAETNFGSNETRLFSARKARHSVQRTQHIVKISSLLNRT